MLQLNFTRIGAEVFGPVLAEALVLYRVKKLVEKCVAENAVGQAQQRRWLHRRYYGDALHLGTYKFRITELIGP